MTLGQATGGRPGAVKRPTTPSLGLGLGLGAKQRAGFQNAAQGGQSGQWLANHPGVQQKIGQINPNSAQGGAQQQRIQQFMGTGQSQKMPRPPTSQPQRGTPPPPQPQTQPMSALPQYGVNPGMQSVLNSRMSQSGYAPQPQQSMDYRFPQQGWSGDNASMQSQLGLMSGGGYGGQPQQMQGYAPQPQQSMNYRFPQQQMGMPLSSQQGFQQAPSQVFSQYGREMQQPGQNWGGGMGYQGAVGGAGWMQQPTQQQLNPRVQQQQPPQASYGSNTNYGMGSL